jgi:poly(A) polymerase Pap1
MDAEMKIASDEEMRRRDSILAEVKRIFLRWVQYVAVHEFKMTEDEAEDAGGDIFISGSHRLGIFSSS